jgi:EF hand
MAGLMAADLDADGAISAEEVAAAVVDLSATARGRLVVQVAKADGDGNGAVSASELAGFGAAAGMAAFGANKLADLQALLGLDSDGDGKVRLDEVKAGLAALGLSA